MSSADYAQLLKTLCLARKQVLTRSVYDGISTNTWTYSNNVEQYAGGTATVTDPIGNVEIRTYSPVKLGNCPLFCSSSSYETEVQYYNSSSSLLRTIQKSYTADVTSEAPGNFPFTVGNVRLTSETTTLNDVTPNLVKQVNTTYEVMSSSYIASGTSYNTTWLNPATVSESDWGSGSPGPILRYTTYTYLHDPSNNPSGYTNYLSRNIANKVLAKSVYDSTSSTCQGVSQPCAQTVNEYDNYTRTNQKMQASNTVQHDNTNYSTSFIYRGNPTAISRWLNTTGSYLMTTNQYDDAGEVLSTIDRLTYETMYSYTDALSWANSACAPSGEAGAYLSKMTNALGQITSYTYDSCTGLRATVTDPNKATTTTTYELLGRVTNITYPDTGSTSYCYTDTGTGLPSCTQLPPPHEVITTTAINSSTPNKVTTTILDDLGRSSQTQLNSDSTTTYTLTTYDADGRTSQVYNPTRCSPITTNCGESTWGYTATGYDPLSRVTSVQEQDTSTVNTTYSGNCTTVTDEAGNARKSCSDGLARITGVWEDPGSSPHLNYETDYTYDALDDLLSVTQKGSNSSNARTRTFQYNSLSELTSATNPESGRITYTYDGDGNVSTKTAPLSNQTGTSTVTTTYSYDQLNRITSKGYKDGSNSDPYTAIVVYEYDDVPVSGCTPPSLSDLYPVGTRTAMCDGSGATSWSHDPMGRVKQEMRTIGAAANKNTYYTYNLDGSLWKLQSSPMNTISYAYSGAARPTSAVDSGDNINFATGATYAPPGELAGLTIGSATSFPGFTLSNAYNPRLQPFQLYAQISSTQIVFSECHDFHLGVSLSTTYNGTTICSVSASTLGDNGNLYQTVNNLNNTRTQSFSYDSLNRIASGQSSGSQWGETFTIDAWGNLTNRTPIAGKTYSEPLNAAPASVQNQLNGFCYDAAGNLALNSSCPQPPITPTNYYDAENRLVWTAGYRYIYDGD
jgi:YD repeat-containing protein